jgi:hypothetical protein
LRLDKSWTPELETQLLLFGVRETGSNGPTAGSPLLTSSLVAAVLDGCTGPSEGPRACLGVAFGAVFTRDDDVLAHLHIPPLAWGAATARLDGKISLARRLALALSLDGFVPVLRPALPGLGTPVSDVPPVGVGLSVGIAYDL